jgi:hypothetical protein
MRCKFCNKDLFLDSNLIECGNHRNINLYFHKDDISKYEMSFRMDCKLYYLLFNYNSVPFQIVCYRLNFDSSLERRVVLLSLSEIPQNITPENAVEKCKLLLTYL